MFYFNKIRKNYLCDRWMARANVINSLQLVDWPLSSMKVTPMFSWWIWPTVKSTRTSCYLAGLLETRDLVRISCLVTMVMQAIMERARRASVLWRVHYQSSVTWVGGVGAKEGSEETSVICVMLVPVSYRHIFILYFTIMLITMVATLTYLVWLRKSLVEVEFLEYFIISRNILQYITVFSYFSNNHSSPLKREDTYLEGNADHAEQHVPRVWYEDRTVWFCDWIRR